MQIEYHKWFSPILGHDMELKVYGYYGKPVLVFPSQQGRFHDFEDWGMTTTLSGFIEAGQIKLFTVNSIDGSRKLSISCASIVEIRSKSL